MTKINIRAEMLAHKIIGHLPETSFMFPYCPKCKLGNCPTKLDPWKCLFLQTDIDKSKWRYKSDDLIILTKLRVNYLRYDKRSDDS